MAVQLNVGRIDEIRPFVVVPSSEAVLGREQRLHLYARRRRIARLKAAGETLVWVGASVGLLLVAAGGLLTLH